MKWAVLVQRACVVLWIRHPPLRSRVEYDVQLRDISLGAGHFRCFCSRARMLCLAEGEIKVMMCNIVSFLTSQTCQAVTSVLVQRASFGFSTIALV